MSKLVKVLALTLFAALGLSLWLSPATTGQKNKNDVDPEAPPQGAVALAAPTEVLTTDMDAKTDDLFNNFGARGTPINECVAEAVPPRSVEHTSELQSQFHLVCRLLLEKKKINT